MVGASAGVMSIFIFISTYSPDLEVRLILFNIKLRYLGIAFVLLDVIQIPYGNSEDILLTWEVLFMDLFMLNVFKKVSI